MPGLGQYDDELRARIGDETDAEATGSGSLNAILKRLRTLLDGVFGSGLTKDYSPTDLNMYYRPFNPGETIYSNWVSVAGYKLICAFTSADQTYYMEIQLGLDAAGSRYSTVALASALDAGPTHITTNQGATVAERARGGTWNYARIVMVNNGTVAGSALAWMHLDR